MKSLIRTISVFVVFALVTGCFALAKDRTERENEEYMVKGRPEPQSRLADTGVEEYKQQEELQKAFVLAARSQPGGERVLVIPAAEIKAEELLTITEDMSVMSYIFDEKLGQVRRHPMYYDPMYYDISGLGSYGGSGGYGGYGGRYFGLHSSATKSIYLDGYGALFVMKVDFLLSPPAETPQEEKPEEGVDPVWQEARQKTVEPEDGRLYWRRRKITTTRPEQKYDAEKVEGLKRKLTKALKHAANIRHLKPDDQVILSVTGRGESDRVTTEVKVQMIPESGQVLVVNKSGDRQETKLYPSKEAYTASLGLSSPTVMTIRAKKADVDAFSKGELDFDKFRQKVQIFTH